MKSRSHQQFSGSSASGESFIPVRFILTDALPESKCESRKLTRRRCTGRERSAHDFLVLRRLAQASRTRKTRSAFALRVKLSTKCRQLERQKWELPKKFPFLHRLYCERGLPISAPLLSASLTFPPPGESSSRALPMRVRLVLYGFVYSQSRGVCLCFFIFNGNPLRWAFR